MISTFLKQATNTFYWYPVNIRWIQTQKNGFKKLDNEISLLNVACLRDEARDIWWRRFD